MQAYPFVDYDEAVLLAIIVLSMQFTLLDERWLPKSVLCLRNLQPSIHFCMTAVAGITVGLVALPLAMAFAIASGLTPQAGSTARSSPAS